MPIQNAEIAAMLDRAGELLEIKGENRFRALAYHRAARILEGLPQSAATLVEAGEDLTGFPGIGKDLAHRIAGIVQSGHFDLLDTLEKEMPGDLVEIAALPGLGPKRVKLLYDQLGVRTIEDLRRAASTGKIRALSGFGAKTEDKILAALARPVSEKRFKLAAVEAEAEALVEFLRRRLGDAHITVAGSYRRRRETVGDLDILVTSRDGTAPGDALLKYDRVASVPAHGPARTTVVLQSGLQVDLRAVPEASYGAALMYFTGSKAHNIALRNIAIEHGWKLNEYGLFRGERAIAGASEEEIYKKLGLAFVPPELREDRGEVALAAKDRLPKLVALDDIRGDLHVHSNWTDGNASIAEMAAAAKQRGYAYIAITDHSRRVTVANGLDPERLLRQIDEIDRLNDTLKGFVVLMGIEVDILSDGRLDLPDALLARLDLVVAAVHYNFGLSRAEQTERIIRAMDHPVVSILAHPSGRLIGSREPYDVDMDRVVAAARERGCHLEVNSQPDRMDLSDLQAFAARQAHAKFAISTDSHASATLGYMRYGVDQARRAWLGPADVINTLPLAQLRKALKR